MKKKFVCTVCGYIYEGEEAPAKCPQCGVPASKFQEMSEEGMSYVTEHVIGVAKGCPQEIWEGLQSHFAGECTEVGMYLAMSRQADREGYPEIAEAFKRYALEEADHASRFAELIGDVVWDTKTNLQKRAEAECGACSGKMEIAKAAKEAGLDASCFVFTKRHKKRNERRKPLVFCQMRCFRTGIFLITWQAARLSARTMALCRMVPVSDCMAGNWVVKGVSHLWNRSWIR